MAFAKTPLIFILILLAASVVVVEIKAATETLSVKEILENKKLKRQLEDLKDHLEEAIDKLDHNIKARQAIFQAEAQSPDDEYVEAIIQQRNDLIAAAAVSETPLPTQAMRINLNSGLRRRRNNNWEMQ